MAAQREWFEKDYYKILGVAKTATADEVKKAYRKLARKYHPDVSKEKGAEERFKSINEAYEVLRDKEKRAAYDQFGHAGFEADCAASPLGDGAVLPKPRRMVIDEGRIVVNEFGAGLISGVLAPRPKTSSSSATQASCVRCTASSATARWTSAPSSPMG